MAKSKKTAAVTEETPTPAPQVKTETVVEESPAPQAAIDPAIVILVTDLVKKEVAAALEEFLKGETMAFSDLMDMLAEVGEKIEIQVGDIDKPEAFQPAPTPTEERKIAPLNPEIKKGEFYVLQGDGQPEHEYPYPDDILNPDDLARWKRQRLKEYCSRFGAHPELVRVV